MRDVRSPVRQFKKSVGEPSRRLLVASERNKKSCREEGEEGMMNESELRSELEWALELIKDLAMGSHLSDKQEMYQRCKDKLWRLHQPRKP